MGIRSIVLSGAAVLGALLAVPAAAGPTPPAPLPVSPMLSLTVTDSTPKIHPGTSVTYAVTVANQGRVPVSAVIHISAPTLLGDLQAADGGTVTGRKVDWTVRVAPQKSTTIRLTGVPSDIGKLSVKACAYLDPLAQATACASDVRTVTEPPGPGALTVMLRLGVYIGLIVLSWLLWLWWRQRHDWHLDGPAEPAEPARKTRPDQAAEATATSGMPTR